MARTTRGRKPTNPQASAPRQSADEVTTPDEEVDERAGTATAVEPAPAHVAESVNSTIVGMPRDPRASNMEDSQEANLEPALTAPPAPAKDGNTADIGKRPIGKPIGGGMIGKKVNAAGMSEDEPDEAYDQETHQKYEQVKRSELHLVDLQRMNPQELHEICKKEGIEDYIGLKKQDLIFKITQETHPGQWPDGRRRRAIEILPVNQFGFLRSPDYNYLPGPDDIYVSPSQIRRFGLKGGCIITGQVRPPKENERASISRCCVLRPSTLKSPRCSPRR